MSIHNTQQNTLEISEKKNKNNKTHLTWRNATEQRIIMHTRTTINRLTL